jgi:hypothetical protein
MKQQSKRRPAPKKLRAIQTSRHLHVVRAEHTGHVLPRRHTSYAALTMVVLVIGALMASWTSFVTADQSQYTVSASVPGPPPSAAATIDLPGDGTQFTDTPITVTGSCPQNTYVSLLRNGFDSGVALCSALGTYQISTDLFSGTDQLIARDYSFTDEAGPDSNMITVYYTPKVVTPPDNTSSGSSSSSSTSTSSTKKTPSTLIYSPTNANAAAIPEPLLLKPNFTFLGYYVGQPASWEVSIAGGSAPYAVEAEWGDGSHSLYSVTSPGALSLMHAYAKVGGYHGSYVVSVTATDAAGAQTSLQLLAIISNPPKGVNALTSGGNQSGSGGFSLFGTANLGRLIDYAWSSYGIVLLMLLSFWLGERREFNFLKTRPKRTHHA